MVEAAVDVFNMIPREFIPRLEHFDEVTEILELRQIQMEEQEEREAARKAATM